MNVQVDHMHLLSKVPPKLSISELMGVLKGRTAIRLFNSISSISKFG
jgi:putative transposase